MKVLKLEAVRTFGDWKVFQDGTLKGIFRLPSGRESEMVIYPDRLADPDLFLRVLAENAADLNDFLRAFFQACELAGIKQITNIQTSFL